jgi:hypothetical protein
LLAARFDDHCVVNLVTNASRAELLGEVEEFVCQARTAAATDGLQPLVMLHYVGHAFDNGDEVLMILRDFDDDGGLLSARAVIAMFAAFAGVLFTADCSRQVERNRQDGDVVLRCVVPDPLSLATPVGAQIVITRTHTSRCSRC